MKQIFLSLFILLLSAPAFAESAYDRVMKSGKIRCGYGTADPLIVFDFDKNAPQGVVVDLMENIASKISLELEWPEETGWANMPTALDNGRIDVACSTLWNDPGRGRLVAFTDPVFYTVLHAYVKEGSSFNFQSVEEMNNPDIRISVQDGDFTHHLAKRLFPKAQHIAISSTNAWNDVLTQVTLGKADVVVISNSSIVGFNQNNDIKLTRVELDEPVTVYGNSFAVSIHETALKEVLNTAVRTLIQTGEIADITEEFRQIHPHEIILPQKPYEVSK